jgi:hypothetical protein
MAGKRYAILIASSRYQDEPGLHELRCPENDVDALNEILGSPEFGQFTETFVLKNAPSHEVQEKMETILAAASKDDLVLIYFSGHGKQMDRSYQLCLATANTRLSALATTSIPAATIKLLFDHSFAKSKILILDCCYSGAVEKAFKGGGVEEELKRMSDAEGTFIMTASTDFQVAVERPEDQLSLFTKHLVAGIRSGEADKNEDGYIDINELHSYVCEKVRQEGTQKPLEWHLRSNGDLILSRSGKDAKKKRRQELRTKICGLAAQGYLSDRALIESLRLVASDAPELTVVAELAAALHSSVNRDAAQLPRRNASPQGGRTIGQYIDHGNGTITDTETGLMWKRCAEGLSGVNCEEGKLEKYTWDDAVESFKDVEYAGYSDWRLPTVDELKTLLYCSKDGSATINQQAFPNTEASPVWSGSPYAGSSDYAWHVNFDGGNSNYCIRGFILAVRLVRSGQ